MSCYIKRPMYTGLTESKHSITLYFLAVIAKVVFKL